MDGFTNHRDDLVYGHSERIATGIIKVVLLGIPGTNSYPWVLSIVLDIMLDIMLNMVLSSVSRFLD